MNWRKEFYFGFKKKKCPPVKYDNISLCEKNNFIFLCRLTVLFNFFFRCYCSLRTSGSIPNPIQVRFSIRKNESRKNSSNEKEGSQTYVARGERDGENQMLSSIAFWLLSPSFSFPLFLSNNPFPSPPSSPPPPSPPP